MKHKVCLISCYFGKWPSYFDVFLETCRRNRYIDFLFVTDCAVPPAHADNIRFLPMNLAQLGHLAAARTGLPISLGDPYKICDLKTLLGQVLAEPLRGYDFWGYTDIDLVYGHIGHYIDDALLDQYDVISARKGYLTGFFFLFRNNDYLNSLYKKSEDYERVLTSEKHYSFSECNFAWPQLWAGQAVADVKTDIDSMSHVIDREVRAGQLRAYFANIARESAGNIPFHWQDGVLTEGGTETLLLHFVWLKGQYYFAFPDWKSVPSEFYITKNGFYRTNEISGWRYWKATRKFAILNQWFAHNQTRVRRRLQRLYS